MKEQDEINNQIERMPDNNYYCNVCNRGFKRKSECYNHIKNEHGKKEIITGVEDEIQIEN